MAYRDSCHTTNIYPAELAIQRKSISNNSVIKITLVKRDQLAKSLTKPTVLDTKTMGKLQLSNLVCALNYKVIMEV